VIKYETVSAVEFFVEQVDSLINKQSKKAMIYMAFLDAVDACLGGTAKLGDGLGVDHVYDAAYDDWQREEQPPKLRFLSLYSGTRPDYIDRPLFVDNDLLVKFEIGNDLTPATDFSGGAAVPTCKLSGEAIALRSGTATFWRITDESGVVHIQGTAGLRQEHPDMVLDTTSIPAGISIGVEARFMGCTEAMFC
jgi:hypothetical protein